MNYFSRSIQWLRNPQVYLENEIKKNHFTFSTRLPVTGKILFTGDPKLIGTIIQNHNLVGGKGIRALRRILGSNSLIMLDGEAHASRRKLLVPRFTDEFIKRYDSMIESLTKEHLAYQKPGEPFSSFSFSSRILLHGVIRILFGKRSESDESGMVRDIENFLGSTRKPGVLFLKPLQINLGKWNGWGRALRNKRTLINRINTWIKNDPPDEALVRSMINETDGSGLEKTQLIDEILSLLLFGHETTAASLAWTFAHIFHTPGIADKIREELQLCRSKQLPLDSENLLFTKACVEESMRINPVVMHLMRVATADVKIGNFQLKKGEMAAPSPFLAQRNPRNFENPNSFIPERFLNNSSESYAYFPFGLGERACLGRHMALRQMVILTAVTLENQQIGPAGKTLPSPVRNMVLVIPEDGMLIKLSDH